MKKVRVRIKNEEITLCDECGNPMDYEHTLQGWGEEEKGEQYVKIGCPSCGVIKEIYAIRSTVTDLDQLERGHPYRYVEYLLFSVQAVRHNVLCTICGFPTYPECRNWCQNEELDRKKRQARKDQRIYI